MTLVTRSIRPDRLLVALMAALALVFVAQTSNAQGAAPPARATFIVTSGAASTLYSLGSSALWRMDLLGQHSRLLDEIGMDGVTLPVRSPDGRYVAYVTGGQSLWQMDVGGRGPRHLYTLAGTAFGRITSLRYTPDGQILTFTAGCCARFTTYSISVHGGPVHQLLAGGLLIFQDWSPDGRTMLYTLDGALWEADSHGGHAHPLGGDVPGAGAFFNARYSPDGSHIAASLLPAQGVGEGPAMTIVMLHPDGRYLTVLTAGLGFDADQPTWSPSGKSIAFLVASGALGSVGRLHDVWMMRYDGSHRQNITHGLLGNVTAVAWSR